MRARLIANPVAGGDRATALLGVINERLRGAFGELEIVLTTGPGDAERLAQRAVAEGRDLLLVAGGDGTVNEVINGAAREAGALQRVTFGVLPLGTGNDFIRALGFPDELEPALERLTARTPAQRLDLGSLNGRLFANASGGGFIAETSESVDPTLKTWAGRLAYLIGGAQVLMDFAPLAGWMHVQDRRRRFEASLFAVCNARTQGGGHLVAPYAWLDDGRLDLCMVAPMPAPELVGMLRSMSRGEHVEDERVVYVQAPWLRLEFDAPVRVNTDGEVLEARACEYRAVPGGARFLVDHPPFLLDGAPAQPIWRL